MPVLFWPLVNALQAGALLAITLSFGADAWTRRDRMMGLLSLCCSLVALRHGFLAGGGIGLLEAAWTLKAQSLLVCLGFVVLLQAMVVIFPRHLPRGLALWTLLAFAPNFARNLFLDAGHPWDRPLHHTANLVYVGASLFLVFRVVQASRDREPMAIRLLYGLVGVAVPVLVEAVVESMFAQKVPLSGFSLLFLAAFLGASWHWVIATDMEAALQAAQVRAEGWRRLLPGPTFDSRESNLLMDRTFGDAWREGLPDVQRGQDGQLYEILDTEVPDGRLGWLRVAHDDQPAAGFLTGWTVALGMDEGPAASEAAAWLQSWGAQVEPWGTLPPREGPYPSVLLWAREPTILAVWREGDRLRRRSRWVQVGGPITEGPHLRMDAPLRREDLEQGLRKLLSV
jgi:hypothetical protein